MRVSARVLAPLALGGLLALIGVALDRVRGVEASGMAPLGQPLGELPLLRGGTFAFPGFTVEARKVTVAPGPAAFRLHALPDPSAPKGGEAESHAVAEGARLTLASGLKVEVEKLLPNAVDVGDLQEAPDGPDNPALRVMLGLGEPAPLMGTLYARQPGGRRLDEPQGRFAVAYLDAWDPALPAALPAKGGPATLAWTRAGRRSTHEAKAGAAWAVDGVRLVVEQVFPDFAVRPGANGEPEPYSRSAAFVDPWAKVRLEVPGQPARTLLLSARQPEVTDQLNAPHLPPEVKVRFHLAEGGPGRWVLITREDAAIRLVAKGKVVHREPFKLNHPFVVMPGCSVTPLFQLRRAVHHPDYVAHPDPTEAARFHRPVLRVRVQDPTTGVTESGWLASEGPEGKPDLKTFFNGRVALAYQPRPLEPEDLRTALVLRDVQGRELATGEVAVDRSLDYGGLRFWQGRDGARDLGAAPLRVTRRPGRPWLLAAGAAGLLALGLALADRRAARRVPAGL